MQLLMSNIKNIFQKDVYQQPVESVLISYLNSNTSALPFICESSKRISCTTHKLPSVRYGNKSNYKKQELHFKRNSSPQKIITNGGWMEYPSNKEAPKIPTA